MLTISWGVLWNGNLLINIGRGLGGGRTDGDHVWCCVSRTSNGLDRAGEFTDERRRVWRSSSAQYTWAQFANESEMCWKGLGAYFCVDNISRFQTIKQPKIEAIIIFKARNWAQEQRDSFHCWHYLAGGGEYESRQQDDPLCLRARVLPIVWTIGLVALVPLRRSFRSAQESAWTSTGVPLVEFSYNQLIPLREYLLLQELP